MTTATFTPHDVPLPAGAVRVYAWETPEETGYPEPVRYFVGTRRAFDIKQRKEPIEVQVDGQQWGDGRVDRYITVNQMHPDWPITAEEARKMADVLLGAADEVDGWAAR